MDFGGFRFVWSILDLFGGFWFCFVLGVLVLFCFGGFGLVWFGLVWLMGGFGGVLVGFGGFGGVAETTKWSYAAQFAHLLQIAGTRA